MNAPTSELQAYLDVAMNAAFEAAQIHKCHAGGSLEIDTKTTDTDLVTQVDKASEARIREIILGAFPDHSILGEEEGERGSSATHRWIVDPLDGTLNYAKGFPIYSVSIGLEVDGVLQVGVVIDSARDELFVATKGGGAFFNGRPMRVSKEANLKRAMLLTGFHYDPKSALQNVTLLKNMLPRCLAIRRPGSAALDLCYVAVGRADGFWELALKPWDIAAGLLILEEAGGRITDGFGEPYTWGALSLVVTNGTLHQTVLDALEVDTLELHRPAGQPT
ncbi:MAG: inositol monophosphatase family protein [Deinococcota bacterium]